LGAEFDFKEKVYIDTSLLVDYATLQDGGAFTILEKALRNQNCESYTSSLSDFEMLSVLRRKYPKEEVFQKATTILKRIAINPIEISEPDIQRVREVIREYARILYKVIENRINLRKTDPEKMEGVREEAPEKMDLYHYATALHRGLDSLASKDKQFCNEPTEDGIIDALRGKPSLKNAKYPRLKYVSEEGQKPSKSTKNRKQLKPEEIEQLEKELGLEVDKRLIHIDRNIETVEP